MTVRERPWQWKYCLETPRDFPSLAATVAWRLRTGLASCSAETVAAGTSVWADTPAAVEARRRTHRYKTQTSSSSSSLSHAYITDRQVHSPVSAASSTRQQAGSMLQLQSQTPRYICPLFPRSSTQLYTSALSITSRTRSGLLNRFVFVFSVIFLDLC